MSTSIPQTGIDRDGHRRSSFARVLPWSIRVRRTIARDGCHRSRTRSAPRCSPNGAACSAEIGEAIVAPGQMTYGSQAAAASQVFAQQRDLALRDRADRAAGARRRGARPARRRGRSGRAFAAASRSRRPARGPAVGRPLHRLPAARPRATADDDRRRPDRSSRSTTSAPPPSACAASRIRTPLVAVRAAGRPAVPQGRVAPADRRVQAPRRVRGDRVAVARGAAPAGSSPTRRATTPRASRGRPDCSAPRPSS